MSIWREDLSESISLVGLSGRLDQTVTPKVESALLKELEEGNGQLIVDMTEVSYVNSGGLRCLLTAWRKANEHDDRIVLCALSDRVKDVFEIVGFDKVFEIYETRSLAVQALENS
ncbi:MAG: STAS domain-containing protein [Anaerolineae bacterium]|nr:MAG: STAS domain-containing protein [Anaerolineae bacterium]